MKVVNMLVRKENIIVISRVMVLGVNGSLLN